MFIYILYPCKILYNFSYFFLGLRQSSYYHSKFLCDISCPCSGIDNVSSEAAADSEANKMAAASANDSTGALDLSGPRDDLELSDIASKITALAADSDNEALTPRDPNAKVKVTGGQVLRSPVAVTKADDKSAEEAEERESGVEDVEDGDDAAVATETKADDAEGA